MGSPKLTEAPNQGWQGWWIALGIATVVGIVLHMGADAMQEAGYRGIAGLLRSFVAPGAMTIGWEMRGLYLATLDRERDDG